MLNDIGSQITDVNRAMLKLIFLVVTNTGFELDGEDTALDDGS